MHARVTTANVRPERFDEAVVAVKETFQPAAREQPGFRTMLVTPATTTTHEVAAFET